MREKLARLEPWTPLPLRVALGIVMVAHGSQKLFGLFDGHGFMATAGFLAKMGFVPGPFWAALVVFAEFGGGLLLLLGLLTRFAAATILIDMLVALFKVHLKSGFFLSNHGIEYVFVLGLIALSLVFSGGGALSLDNLFGRKEPLLDDQT